MGTISLGAVALEAAGRTLGVLRIAGARLAAAVVVVLDWQRRANERHTLMSLDARMLRDIGITQSEAEREAHKPFWVP